MFNKVVFLEFILFTVLSISIATFAQSNADELETTGQGYQGEYQEFQMDPDAPATDRVFESMAGKYKKSYCDQSLKRACGSGQVARICRMNVGSGIKQGCTPSCLSWVVDCGRSTDITDND